MHGHAQLAHLLQADAGGSIHWGLLPHTQGQPGGSIAHVCRPGKPRQLRYLPDCLGTAKLDIEPDSEAKGLGCIEIKLRWTTEYLRAAMQGTRGSGQAGSRVKEQNPVALPGQIEGASIDLLFAPEQAGSMTSCSADPHPAGCQPAGHSQAYRTHLSVPSPGEVPQS